MAKNDNDRRMENLSKSRRKAEEELFEIWYRRQQELNADTGDRAVTSLLIILVIVVIVIIAYLCSGTAII